MGAGLSVGLGFSAGIEFDIDASELMRRYNLPDLATLLDWIDKFRKDPSAAFKELIDAAKKAAIDAGMEIVNQAVDKAKEVVVESMDKLKDAVVDMFPWLKGDSDDEARFDPPTEEKATATVTSPNGGGTAGGEEYDRRPKLNEWSK